VEPAHFDWRSRERPALALLAWEAMSCDPMARLRRIQVESIGTTINFARSFLRLQPELDEGWIFSATCSRAQAAFSQGGEIASLKNQQIRQLQPRDLD
jgi:hypothetical protein